MLRKIKGGKIHVKQKAWTDYECGTVAYSDHKAIRFKSRKDLLAHEADLCKRCIKAVGGIEKFPCR